MHPMAGHLTYLYAVCVASVLAYLFSPSAVSQKLAVAGFVIWYLWAAFVINGYEY